MTTSALLTTGCGPKDLKLRKKTLVANGKYRGQLKNGKPHGLGILRRGRVLYIGEFRNGRYHGVGYRKTPQGKFLGEYRRSATTGAAYEHWKNGGRFAGMMRQGVRRGPGFELNAGGSWYAGRFLPRDEQGTARELAPEISEANEPEPDGGTGIADSSGQKKKPAQKKQGSKPGVVRLYGVKTWKDGDVYLGQWHRNRFDGWGIFYKAMRTSPKDEPAVSLKQRPRQDFQEYCIGLWRQNYRFGPALAHYRNGAFFLGEFRRDRRWQGDYLNDDGSPRAQYTSGVFRSAQ